jgi:acyl-lipid omega-6 desaturase (Delta-12 desaturase)
MNTHQRLYVHLTTLAIIVLNGLLIMVMGFTSWLMIQLPVIFLASVAGVWLFYVQHQYSDVIWKRSKDWNYREIALFGSSFYKLPRILQWFSGNIGFHHIHHLGPRIPNYKLEKCHYEHNDLWKVKPISLKDSIGSLRLRLWDEQNQRLISFSEMQ